MLSFIAILFIVVGAIGLVNFASITELIQVLLFIVSMVLLIRFMEIAKR